LDLRFEDRLLFSFVILPDDFDLRCEVLTVAPLFSWSPLAVRLREGRGVSSETLSVLADRSVDAARFSNKGSFPVEDGKTFMLAAWRW
jgi:hypothetical protein